MVEYDPLSAIRRAEKIAIPIIGAGLIIGLLNVGKAEAKPAGRDYMAAAVQDTIRAQESIKELAGIVENFYNSGMKAARDTTYSNPLDEEGLETVISQALPKSIIAGYENVETTTIFTSTGIRDLVTFTATGRKGEKLFHIANYPGLEKRDSAGNPYRDSAESYSWGVEEDGRIRSTTVDVTVGGRQIIRINEQTSAQEVNSFPVQNTHADIDPIINAKEAAVRALYERVKDFRR